MEQPSQYGIVAVVDSSLLTRKYLVPKSATTRAIKTVAALPYTAALRTAGACCV